MMKQIIRVFNTIICLFAWNNLQGQIQIDSLQYKFLIEDRYPSFFPDGKRIIFQSNRVTGNYEIFTANLDGSDLKQMTNNDSDDVTPVVSPDGKTIVYCSCPDDHCDVMTMNIDGTNVRNLTNSQSDDSHPKFFDRGRKIIFSSDRERPGNTPRTSVSELYEMSMDGSNVRKITHNLIWSTYPSYSPDGMNIVYRRIIKSEGDTSKLNSEVFIINSKGEQNLNLTNHESYDAYPEFSPDGNWILFSSNRNGLSTSNYDLFVMDKNGENLQQVSFHEPNESDQRATWAPDGKSIIFNRDDGKGNVRIVTASISPVLQPQVFNLVEESAINDEKGCSRGLAWGDYDNDGLADVVIANSNNQNLRLYKNLGKGKFKRQMDNAIAEFADYTEGVAWIDYDNDHDLDLFVTAQNDGQNVMFRNDSLRRFTKVTLGDLTSDQGNSNSSCWCDFDNDGDVDVFVSHRNSPGSLYENINVHDFRKVSSDRFPNLKGDGRTCAWGDIDGDGYYDLFMGNFSETMEGKTLNGQNYLLKSIGGKSFEAIITGDVVTPRGRTYGSSFADVDNDGDADLIVTKIGRNDTSYLYLNNGKGIFRKKYISHGKPSKGHVWGDYNLDGNLDFMIANGTENISLDKVNDNLLYGEGNGTFSLVSHGALVIDAKISAAVATSDFDNDGDLDLLITNWGNNFEENRLYRNDVHNMNWVEFKLSGTVSNSYGIGSKITIKYVDQQKKEKAQTRWLMPQTGYASQNDYVIHFGLGKVEALTEVTVTWPTGAKQILRDVSINRKIDIVEKGNRN